MAQPQTVTAYYQSNPGVLVPFSRVVSLHDPEAKKGGFGWGLHIVDISNVMVYNFGLYNFFDNYDVSSLQTQYEGDCQRRIPGVERSSVAMYGSNTIGTPDMITLDGKGVMKAKDNQYGFVDTLALFRSQTIESVLVAALSRNKASLPEGCDK